MFLVFLIFVSLTIDQGMSNPPTVFFLRNRLLSRQYYFLTGSSDIKDLQEKCIPVSLHCQSFSEPCSRSYSQKIPGYTDTKNSKWFPESHPQCVHRQPHLDGRWSLKWLQVNKNVQNNSEEYCSGSNSDIYNQSLVSQPRTFSNEELTIHVAVNNQRRQNDIGFMSPSHGYTKFSPPAKCHCPGCPSYLCTQEIEQNYSSCNKKRPEKEDIPKSSSVVHIPSVFQKTDAAQDGQNNVASKQLSNSQSATLKISDYYEEQGTRVEQIFRKNLSSREETRAKHSNLSYARKIDGFDENHHRRHLSSAVVFQDPILENVPFREGDRQQDFVAGSKKRKNRQRSPQKVREEDPAQLTGNGTERAHYQYIQSEKLCESRSRPQANPLSFHDPSITSELRDPKVRVTTSPCEDVSSGVHSYLGWMRKYDDSFIKDTPWRPQVCRNYIAPDTQPPYYPLSKGRKTTEEMTTPIFVTQQVQSRAGSSFGEFSSEYSLANQLSLKHEKSAFPQSKTPDLKLGITPGNLNKRPDYLKAVWKLDPQHWYAPTSLEVSKIQFETLDKQRASLESVHKVGPFPMQVALGPSQLNIDREGCKVDPCDDQYIPCNLKRRAAPSKEGPLKEDMDSPPSSLSSDQGGVTSTTLDDKDGLQQTQASEQSNPTADANTLNYCKNLKKHTEEKLVTFPESHSPFFNGREIYGNFMSPSMKEKRFVCRFCCKKFAHFSTLQNHVRTHTGDKPFQCKFCSRRFAQSGVLKAHLRTHTGEKPFVCMYCGKMFAQSTTLTNHLRTHTGQKPYICHCCGKCFSQPSTLRKHELSHTKERPYSCKFCGKAFAQQSTLTNHMRSHTGQRPYKCHFCEKSFAQLSTLYRHLRLHSSGGSEVSSLISANSAAGGSATSLI